MQVEEVQRATRRAAERLYEDERLRSNMSDSEASIVLDWGAQWIEDRLAGLAEGANAQTVLQNELARVRQAILSFNELAKKPGNLRLADAVSVLESSLQAQSLSRDQAFRLLTTLTTTIWTMPASQVNPQLARSDPNRMTPTEE